MRLQHCDIGKVETSETSTLCLKTVAPIASSHMLKAWLDSHLVKAGSSFQSCEQGWVPVMNKTGSSFQSCKPGGSSEMGADGAGGQPSGPDEITRVSRRVPTRP